MAGTIREILDRKGHEVVTIGPDRPLADAVKLLEEHSIGALVVSGDGQHVDGMLSERDIVRLLARSGREALDQRVSSVMTRSVTTAAPSTTADELMRTMTDNRFRHVPVLEDGALTGIVSIGDVVKSRIDALELEREKLEDYVTGSSY